MEKKGKERKLFKEKQPQTQQMMIVVVCVFIKHTKKIKL